MYDCPEDIASHIFDVFLLDGEQVIFTLIIKMIEHREKHILSIEDDEELLNYLRSHMVKDCLKAYPMTKLLD